MPYAAPRSIIRHHNHLAEPERSRLILAHGKLLFVLNTFLTLSKRLRLILLDQLRHLTLC